MHACDNVAVVTALPVLTFFCHFWVIAVGIVFLDADNCIAAGGRTCTDGFNAPVILIFTSIFCPLNLQNIISIQVINVSLLIT